MGLLSKLFKTNSTSSHPSVVSVRGQGQGRTYPADTTTPTQGPHTQPTVDDGHQNTVGTDSNLTNRNTWTKNFEPGGRKLWCRLVVGFICVSVLGAAFVTVGAVFFRESHRIAMEEGMSVAMVWCIIGMVSGVLLIAGSFVLGKLIISDKWRKNQQPTYRNMATPSVRFVARPAVAESRSTENTIPRNHLEFALPPSYEEAASAPQEAPLSIISRNIDQHDSADIRCATDHYPSPPPMYTEQPVITSPPPAYTESEPGGNTVNTDTDTQASSGSNMTSSRLSRSHSLSGVVDDSLTQVDASRVQNVLSGHSRQPEDNQQSVTDSPVQTDPV